MNIDTSDVRQAFENAQELEIQDVEVAKAKYRELIFSDWGDQDAIRLQEQSIYVLGNMYVRENDAQAIIRLTKELRPILAIMPKAKSAKIVRVLIDSLSKIPESSVMQVDACLDCIQWCKKERRSFLRQRVETRLAALYLDMGKYHDTLNVLTALLREVKKLDDKLLLVEIHVIETRTNISLMNIPKARASLTAAKTNANAIHCPPVLQAEIDLLSGIVNSHEKDFKTSYSYFFEAFEAFSMANDTRADVSMRYMLLSKIMCDQPKDVVNICNSKSGLQYVDDRGVEALKEIAKTHQQRSLEAFEIAVGKYKDVIFSDPVLKHHVEDLNETLLEQNLSKVTEPFSRVEIEHVAEILKLPLNRIQKKLSEMILDGKLSGTLDQGNGTLMLYDSPHAPAMYNDILVTIDNISNAMNVLYKKAQRCA